MLLHNCVPRRLQVCCASHGDKMRPDIMIVETTPTEYQHRKHALAILKDVNWLCKAKKDKQKARKQQAQALSSAPPSSEPSETDTAAPANCGNACVTTSAPDDKVASRGAVNASDMHLLSHGTSVGVPLPAEQTLTGAEAALNGQSGRKKSTVSKQSTGFSAEPLDGRSDEFARQCSMPAEGSKLAGSVPQRSRHSNGQAADVDASTAARQCADGAETLLTEASSADVGEVPRGKMLSDEAHAWTSDEAELRVLLSCPLTKAVMRDPVIAADGHTYERVAMEEWLTQHTASPVTGNMLAHTKLISNVLIRGILQQHML